MGLLFIITLICIVHGTISWTDNTVRRFKDEFLFGAASASYQVEGAWDVDGKSESIWDNFLHKNPDILPDGRNGDVAANSYEFYKRDVEMLRELGVDYYRFSTSWPRVLPTGLPNEKNEKGLQYYDNLIDELLQYNIEPMVTLYHWDLPQRLQDLGGWANPLIIDWFVDYAKVMFDRYGDRVKYWLTINQPNSVCMESYGDSIFAPATNMRGIADYMCMKHIMLAHAKVYRLYEAVYKKKYEGSVGIAISANWVDSINNKTENVQAAEEYRQYLFGLFINPIYSKEGGFPRAVVDIVAKKSRDEGYTRSRLPELSSQEKALIKGSSDFLGINHYTTVLATRGKSDFDIDVTLTQSEQWGKSQSRWLRSAPYGLYKVLLYINKHYDYPPIIITENGFSTGVGVLDEARVEYMNNYLAALLLAIEDGTNVGGYTAWSLLDNVEWIMGTSERFGLYEVDFDAEDKKRTARLSALVYKNIINTRKIDKDFAPKDLKIKISKRRANKMKQEL